MLIASICAIVVLVVLIPKMINEGRNNWIIAGSIVLLCVFALYTVSKINEMQNPVKLVKADVFAIGRSTGFSRDRYTRFLVATDFPEYPYAVATEVIKKYSYERLPYYFWVYDAKTLRETHDARKPKYIVITNTNDLKKGIKLGVPDIMKRSVPVPKG